MQDYNLAAAQPYINLDAYHVMIDWETLGLQADCKLLSLGVAAMHTGNADIIHANWNISQSDAYNRQRYVDTDTSTWWGEQVRKHPLLFDLLSQDQMPIYLALERLYAFLGSLAGSTYYLWGNGADFDLAILAHAIRQTDMPALPGNYRYTNNRCFRTVKNLFPQILAPQFRGYKHYAADDALHEAVWLAKILQEGIYPEREIIPANFVNLVPWSDISHE